jgi:hypothetical protein
MTSQHPWRGAALNWIGSVAGVSASSPLWLDTRENEIRNFAGFTHVINNEPAPLHFRPPRTKKAREPKFPGFAIIIQPTKC